MSKKNERVQKLIKINNTLNEPASGLDRESEYCTYSKETILLIMVEVESLLKLDGVFAMDANSKVGG